MDFILLLFSSWIVLIKIYERINYDSNWISMLFITADFIFNMNEL